MKSLAWPVVLGVVCAGVAVATAEPAADEAKKLHGTWVVESTSKDAQLASPWKGGQWVFAKDTASVTWPLEKEPKVFPLTVDSTKSPKIMDFAPPKGSSQAPWPMIYELDGDTLKLCIGSRDKRPARFTNKDGFVLVLKRKK